MTIFKELLSIKSFRENRAELAMLKQRNALASAITARDEAEKSLAAFVDEAQKHELALYADLCRRLVRLRDLENVQQEVLDLRNRERGIEEQLAQSEATRDSEQRRLDETRLAHQQAYRMKQKFVELARVYSDEALQELERAEDAEMEEVAELRRDRAEWRENFEELA